MNFTTELYNLRLEAFKLRCPGVYLKGEPYYKSSVEVKKPAKASQMESLIVEFITLKDHQANKVSTMGVYRDETKVVTDVLGHRKKIGSGTWTPGTATKGAADISSTIYGIKVEWEVKFSKSDRQSKSQKKYEADVKKAKGFYFVVRTLDEFYNRYYELIEMPQFVLMKGFC